MFGFKFGSNLPEENILKKHNDKTWPYEVKPIIKNDDFTDYYVQLTPTSKKIESVMANSTGKMSVEVITGKDKRYNLPACKKKMEDIKILLTKKYKLKVTKKEDLGLWMDNKFSHVSVQCLVHSTQFTSLIIISSNVHWGIIGIREKDKIKEEKLNIDRSGY